MSAIDGMACATPGCDNRGKQGFNIVGHGSIATKSGRWRRYRCTVCKGTLSTNSGTGYRGLRCTRREFEQVASLRVEGVSISATARVTGHSRTTIARWLERASTAAARFNDRMLRDFDLIELQADELCTFIGSKRKTVWLFATIEVSSRLWAGGVLGRRSARNARAVIDGVVRRGRVVGCPLIVTDGFEYYVGAMVDLFGSACVYGQVLKTRRNNRVVRVERRVVEAAQHPVVEALRGGRGPLEPTGDGVTGMPRDSGGRGKAHAFDAQAGYLLELPSRAAKTAVRGPGVCADGSPADGASVPLPSAGLRRK